MSPSPGQTLNPKSWRKHLKPDLNRHNLLLILKGALPPTIVIAIHQSSAVANTTLTIGYLAALLSVLSQALTPRAKFLRIMLFDLLATCVSASLCCLAIFCAGKARQNSGDQTPSSSSSSSSTYNSSASAVSAIWLIAMIWAGNALRAWKPMELQDPMVAFSIFCSVTLTRAGTFVVLADGLAFVARLLKGFMLGFAIATGVSLFIYPVTSRGLVFGDVTGYVGRIEGVLRAYSGFVGGSVGDWEGADADSEEDSGGDSRKRLKGTVAGLNAVHARLQSDLFYSRDEIAWGKLSASDLDRIGGLLRDLFLPLSGMAMLPDVLDMVVKRQQDGSRNSVSDAGGTPQRLDIENVVETLNSRIGECSGLVTAGLQYVLLKLELMTPKQLDKGNGGNMDEESGRTTLDPTQTGFMSQFEKRMNEYYSRQKQLPRTLASREAFITEKTNAAPDEGTVNDIDIRQEFFIVLFTSQLQDKLVKETLEFMRFADAKVADGTMKRNRIIFPVCSIRKWLSGSSKDTKSTTSSVPEHDNKPTQYPDPEHLPPANKWERASTVFRSISSVIKSEQSIFGFRVAAASFCVGILAFLHQTQDFFVRQRCIWAMIVIVIGMSPTSGQTLLGFITRIAATVVSLALSLMVWYIPDQKTAGVIVFLYLANVFEYYFYVTKPQVFGPSIIAIVTLNVIVGYELQMRKLGLEVGTSNGQPYYPIYLFGPYKLLAVAAGCAISFIWVILPYPVTSKSRLRKSLGSGLFLLARFYSCMHSSIELWLRGQLDDTPQIQYGHPAQAPMAELQKARKAIFKEEMTLLARLGTLSHFSTFEPPIGGKFPRATYDAIIDQVQRILISMALMAQMAQSPQTQPPPQETLPPDRQLTNTESKSEKTWSTRLATVALQSTEFKSHATTSLLCHLGSAITNAQPLPPYLSAGGLFPLARWVRHVDAEMLSLRHVDDPGFAIFGLLEVLRSVVGVELEGLLGNVRQLVGELSFDFHAQIEGEGEESRALMSGI